MRWRAVLTGGVSGGYWLSLLIIILFVASGFSSLIYQVVWTRMLVFVFGSTTFATATVLSVFMGGLALGSFVAGRRADLVKRPFLWYGILEGIIGVWALLVPSLFDTAVPLYQMIWRNFHLTALPFGILRFSVALLILLLPTTCMGATLPLLAKFVTDSLEYVGSKIGTLYAANTFGAVAGAAVAGLYLLPALGLHQSTLIAALINFVLIAIVVFVSKRVEFPHVAAGISGPHGFSDAATRDDHAVKEPVTAANSGTTSLADVSNNASTARVDNMPAGSDTTAMDGSDTRAIGGLSTASGADFGSASAGLSNAIIAESDNAKIAESEASSVEPSATTAIDGSDPAANPGSDTTPVNSSLTSAPTMSGNQSGRVSSARLSTQVVVTMIGFGISGAVAMIYEVGWTRTLLMVIGSSTYAFTLMLTSFLTGIFLGSLVCARFIDRAKDPLAWFAIIQFLVGAASLFSMDRFNYVPYWNLQLNAALPNDPNTALAARFAIAASIMMPLTFFLGAVFPAAVKACVNNLSSVGKSVGTLYSCNTLGAIIGSFLAGFVLIPLFGVEKSLIAGTVLNLLSGVMLLCFVSSIRLPIKALVAVVGCLACFTLSVRSQIWDRQTLVCAQSARRMLQRTQLFKSLEDWRKELYSQNKLLFYEDGASSTVGVLGWAKVNGITSHSLVTNGHVDASDENDMSTQILLADAPIAAHPAARDVAIIGWGSGVTIGAAARLTNGNITAIELEPAVIETSKYFAAVNHSPENDPRVHIEINDGRNFLLATDQRFDVIISEPSNPWQAGVCNLFTREYFQLCKNRLRPGGVFGVWCQIVEVPGVNVRGILSALRQVFPHCAVMLLNECDIVVLASDNPIQIDLDKLRESMKNKDVAEDFRRAAIDSPETFAARFVIAPDGIDNFIHGIAPNVDDTNRLEYDVGRIYENHNSLTKNREMFDRNSSNLSSVVKWSGKSPEQVASGMCAIGKNAQLLGFPERTVNWVQASLKLKKTAEANRLLGIVECDKGNVQRAADLWNEALKLDPSNVETFQTRGLVHLNSGDRVRARQDFTRALAIQPGNKVAVMRIARTYAPRLIGNMLCTKPSGEEDPQKVVELVMPLLKDAKFVDGHPFVYWLAAWGQYCTGHLDEAQQLARKFAVLDPLCPAGAQLLGMICSDHGEFPEASLCWKALLQQGPQLKQVLLEQAQMEMKGHRYQDALDTMQALLVVFPNEPHALAELAEISKHEPRAAALLSQLRQFTENP